MKTATLIILDGWGEGLEKPDNAIYLAKTPHWDKLKQTGHFLQLNASGQGVGLPLGQMGNSEVGHMHIGAGRVLAQDLTRINAFIKEEGWDNHPILEKALHTVQKNQSNLHLIGLLSPGGVHSHEQHLFSLIQTIDQKLKQPCFIHAILDGRDTPPNSAKSSLAALEMYTNDSVQIASLSGRYYAMDRDKRWDRTQLYYDLLTLGESDFQDNTALAGLESAYKRHESDEFIKPIRLKQFQTIKDNDVVLCMNFRADRMRQLCTALTEKNFTGFKRRAFPKILLKTLTEYEAHLKAEVIFERQKIRHTLGEMIAKHDLKQCRLAETEKYAHVTFFLNGGREDPFPNETRYLIPSPKVKTYDLKPEMSAYELTEALCDAIESECYTLIVANYANADMVGHTGNLSAAIEAVEAIDNCLGKIHQAIQSTGSELLITADHGNAEHMFDDDNQQPHTAHTKNLVPCLHWGTPMIFQKTEGTLIDIAPTILSMLNIPIPSEMTGEPLFKLDHNE